MSDSQERAPEVAKSSNDPFADETSPAIKHVIDRWYLDDAPENAVLVIEGHVTEMTTSWTIKEGDWLNAKVTYEPMNLKCDILVYHPQAAIIAEKGDLGIVAEVFRQFGTMTGREAKRVMVAYQHKVYPEPPKEGTRISAGEGRDTASETVEF